MLRKQVDIPPEATKTFVKDMKAYFKAQQESTGMGLRPAQAGC
jgi:hypothetical protein